MRATAHRGVHPGASEGLSEDYTMRIALDVMGGDHAPHEIVHGAVEASLKLKEIACILMVGDETVVRAELAKYPKADLTRLRVVHAPESIGMDELPATAVRKKKLCSINICMDLLKSKEADAMVSAGNSGAVAAAAVFGLGRIPGVIRPAIATVLPTRQPARLAHPRTSLIPARAS